MWKVNWSTRHEHRTNKKIWISDRNRTLTFRTPEGRSIHWVTRTHGEPGHLTEFIWDRRPAYCWDPHCLSHREKGQFRNKNWSNWSTCQERGTKNLRSEFFFVPRSCNIDQFIFHISLPSSKFTVFIHLSLLMMTSAVLILAVHRTPATYVAPVWYSGGYGFDSCREFRLFICATLMSCWSIYLSHFITELKIHYLYLLINAVMTGNYIIIWSSFFYIFSVRTRINLTIYKDMWLCLQRSH